MPLQNASIRLGVRTAPRHAATAHHRHNNVTMIPAYVKTDVSNGTMKTTAMPALVSSVFSCIVSLY